MSEMTQQRSILFFFFSFFSLSFLLPLAAVLKQGPTPYSLGSRRRPSPSFLAHQAQTLARLIRPWRLTTGFKRPEMGLEASVKPRKWPFDSVQPQNRRHHLFSHLNRIKSQAKGYGLTREREAMAAVASRPPSWPPVSISVGSGGLDIGCLLGFAG